MGGDRAGRPGFFGSVAVTVAAAVIGVGWLLWLVATWTAGAAALLLAVAGVTSGPVVYLLYAAVCGVIAGLLWRLR